MAVKLDTYDGGMEAMEIDTLCHGPVSEDTPSESIETIYVPKGKPIIDGYDPEWFAGFLTASKKYSNGTGSVEIGKDPCIRPKDLGKVDIIINPVDL
jgi:hypothetical protein